jgi:hypothetical protein
MAEVLHRDAEALITGRAESSIAQRGYSVRKVDRKEEGLEAAIFQ